MAFAVYLLTNVARTVLYIGVTSDLERRLAEHSAGLGEAGKFTGRYQANLLVYFELCPTAKQAIAREKQLKGWNRTKKEALISGFNPAWEAIDLETWQGGSGLGLPIPTQGRAYVSRPNEASEMLRQAQHDE